MERTSKSFFYKIILLNKKVSLKNIEYVSFLKVLKILKQKINKQINVAFDYVKRS